MDHTFWSRLRGAKLVRVLAVYFAASWLILQVSSLLQDQLELPRWLTPVAFVLLAIGLVIISATAWVQSHPAASPAAAEEIPGAWEIDLREAKDSVTRGRLPHLTWARAILGGVVAFAFLFGLAGLYVVVNGRGPGPSPHEAVAGGAAPGIAVLPFAVNDRALANWREGMVDLLSTDLGGVTGLRAIDSRTVLARWRESVTGSETPDLETALEVARRTGARYALLGSAVASGPGMRLTADVYELANGKLLGSGQVEGSADSVFGLVDRLSIETLRAIVRGEERELPRVNLARATTTSLPALKAYLEGEVLFRRSDFPAATAAYQRAIEADSTFALALMRLWDAYAWTVGDFGNSMRLAPGSKFDVSGRLTQDLAFGGPAARLQARAALDTLPTLLLATIGGNLWHPRFLKLQEEIFQLRRQRSDAPPVAAVVLFFNRYLQGKLHAFEAADDPLLPPGFNHVAAYQLFALGLPVSVDRLDRELTVNAAESLGAQGGARFAIFYAGAYAADRGRWSDHEKAVAWLRSEAQRALGAADSTEARFVEGEALALEGYRQWKEGRREEAVRDGRAAGHRPRS